METTTESRKMRELHDAINSVELVMNNTYDLMYDKDGYYTHYADSYYALREVYNQLKREYFKTYGHDWYNYYSLTDTERSQGVQRKKEVVR